MSGSSGRWSAMAVVAAAVGVAGGALAWVGAAAGAAGGAEPPAKDRTGTGGGVQAPAGAKDAAGPARASQAGSAAMEALKSLAGTWESADKDGDGAPDGTTVYRVSSAGSVVIETMLPGTAHEMTNAFHMDGKDLVFTHYCAMGNQPRLRCEDPQNGNVLVFRFKDGTNLDAAADHYMGGLKLTIVDKDHIRQEWTSFKAGKPEGEHAVFELRRRKP
jgi:hypothetical protein